MKTLAQFRPGQAAKLPAILFVFAMLCLLAPASFAEQNKDKDKKLDPAKLLEDAAKISDEILRLALNNFIASINEHTLPPQGGGTSEVLKICRASQGVYCQFMGFRAQYPLSTVESARSTILKSYEFALERISWIKEQANPDTELALAYASIADKKEKIQNARSVEKPYYIAINQKSRRR